MTNFKFCPMCASSGFSSLGDKAHFCANCGFTLYLNAAAAVAAIIEHEDDILLVIRGKAPEKGKLDLPGGFVDHNETAEQALARELEEELGLTGHDAEYLFSCPNTYPYKGVTYRTLDLFYRMRLEQRPVLVSADDVAGFQWINRESIPLQDIAFASVRRALQQHFDI